MIVPYLTDAEFGVKYVALIEGKIREAFLVAVTLDERSNDYFTPQYVLEAAGIGEVRVDFDIHAITDDGEELLQFDSILADSWEDYMGGKFHKYFQLCDNDPFSFDYLQLLLPGFSFNPIDGITSWLWDKKNLKPYKADVNWRLFRLDASDAKIHTNIPEDYYYPTKEACIEAHFAELELVTF